MNQRHLAMKLIASAVVFTFTLTSLGITPNTFAATGVPNPEVSSFTVGTLAIPAELGQVTETVTGDPKALAFIHIQSAHGNYQAEKNIEKLLSYIEKNSSVKTMFLEGAAGKLNPELFRLFPGNPDFSRKVTDKLMQEGYLTGPERFLIENSGQEAGVKGHKSWNVERGTWTGFGVEDLDAYKKDREAFISVVKKEKTAENYLMKLRASIDKRFASKLNKDLLNLVRQEEALASGTVNFSSWIKTLGEGSKKHLKTDLSDAFYQDQYPSLIRYFRLQTIGSKIDRDKARQEADAFLNELARRKISKEVLANFKNILQLPEMDLLKTVSRTTDGYSTLRRAFDLAFNTLSKDFSMTKWPNWTLYAQYIILMQEMEGKGLHEETVRLKDKIQTALAKTTDEREYLAQARQLYLLKRLFALELTREEYEELVRSNAYGVRSNPTSQGNAVKKLYDSAMSFYSIAIVREQHMFSNALQRMSLQKQDRAVIVTGGFHADGLKKLASSRNCSYIQITPRIAEVSQRDHEVYLRSIVGSRGLEISQMSALLGLVDRAQRVAVTGVAATKDWASGVRELILSMINSEAVTVRAGLKLSFSKTPISAPAPALARSEMRVLAPDAAEAAVKLFDYMAVNSADLPKDPVVVVLGNPLEGYPAYVAKALEQLKPSKVLIVGNGVQPEDRKTTVNPDGKDPEWQRIQEALIAADPSLKDKILVDPNDESMSTSENIAPVISILNREGLSPQGVVLVQVPQGLRGSQGTFLENWAHYAKAGIKEPRFFAFADPEYVTTTREFLRTGEPALGANVLYFYFGEDPGPMHGLSENLQWQAGQWVKGNASPELNQARKILDRALVAPDGSHDDGGSTRTMRRSEVRAYSKLGEMKWFKAMPEGADKARIERLVEESFNAIDKFAGSLWVSSPSHYSGGKIGVGELTESAYSDGFQHSVSVRHYQLAFDHWIEGIGRIPDTAYRIKTLELISDILQRLLPETVEEDFEEIRLLIGEASEGRSTTHRSEVREGPENRLDSAEEAKLDDLVSKIVAGGSSEKLNKIIQEEAKKTGRDEWVVRRGIVGRDYDPNDDNWPMMSNARKGPVHLTWIGGGGEGITKFARAMLRLARETMSYKEYKEFKATLLAVINDGPFDDGGDTHVVREQLMNSRHWPRKNVVVYGGDRMSALWRMTVDDAKQELLDDGFRMEPKVNVNSPALTKDELLYVMDLDSRDAIWEARESFGRNFFETFDLKTYASARERKQKDVLESILKGFPEKFRDSLTVERREKEEVRSVIEQLQVLIGKAVKSGQDIADPRSLIVKAVLQVKLGNDLGSSRFTFFGKTLSFSADSKHQIKLLDFVEKRLAGIQKKIEKGELAKPEDWTFFVANMIGYAILAERILFDSHDMTLGGRKWQNILDVINQVETGRLVRDSADLDLSRSTDKEYESLGIAGGIGDVVTREDATMAVLLEASVLRVGHRNADGSMSYEAFLIGPPNKDQAVRIRQVPNEMTPVLYGEKATRPVEIITHGGDVLPVALDHDESMLVTNGKIAPLGDFSFGNEGGKITVSKSGKPLFKVFEDLDSPGHTKMTTNLGTAGTETTVEVRRDGAWDSVPLESAVATPAAGTPKTLVENISSEAGLEFHIKSRKIEEQTNIADDISSSRIFKLQLKRALRTSEEYYDYEKYGGEGAQAWKDKLNSAGDRKMRKFKDLKREEYPETTKEIEGTIDRTVGAFAFGESGLVTSVLPNFLVRGVVDRIAKCVGWESGSSKWKETAKVRFFYYPKLSVDVETYGSSLSEQLQMMDRSIKDATGGEIGISDLITDVIIPNIKADSPIRKRAHKKYIEELKKFADPVLQEKIKARTEKFSKHFPLPIIEVTKDDEAYLKSKGIRVHKTSNFDFSSKGKLVYEKTELVKFMDVVMAREAMLNLIPDAQKRDSIRKSMSGQGFSKEQSASQVSPATGTEENDLEGMRPSPGGFFWPISDWRLIMNAVAESNPKAVETITMVYHGVESGRDRSFEVTVPKLSEELTSTQKAAAVKFLRTCIYNRLGSLGTQKVGFVVQSDGWKAIVDNEILKNDQGIKLMLDFVEIAKNSKNVSDSFPMTEVVPQIQAQTPEQTLAGGQGDAATTDRGLIVGLHLTGKSIFLALNREGKPSVRKQMSWDPASYRSRNEYVAKIKQVIDELGLSKSERLAAVGISWPAAVYGNQVISRSSELFKGIGPTREDFEKAIYGLDATLSAALEVPVTMVKDGAAMASWYFKNSGVPASGADPVGMPTGKEANVLFLGMNDTLTAHVGTASNDNSERYLGEIGNLIVDMGSGAASHPFTKVRGAAAQYLSLLGARRISVESMRGGVSLAEISQKLVKLFEALMKSDFNPDLAPADKDGIGSGFFAFEACDLKGSFDAQALQKSGLVDGWDRGALDEIRSKLDSGEIASDEAWVKALNIILKNRMSEKAYRQISDAIIADKSKNKRKPSKWKDLGGDTEGLLTRALGVNWQMNSMEVERLNRRLLEVAFPEQIQKTSLSHFVLKAGHEMYENGVFSKKVMGKYFGNGNGEAEPALTFSILQDMVIDKDAPAEVQHLYEKILRELGGLFAGYVALDLRESFPEAKIILLPSSVQGVDQKADSPAHFGVLKRASLKKVAGFATQKIKETDSNLTVMLEDDLSYADIVDQFGKPYSPQVEAVFLQLADYLAEAIVELGYSYDNITKVVLAGEVMAPSVRGHLKVLTMDALKMKLGDKSPAIEVIKHRQPDAPYMEALGAAYEASRNLSARGGRSELREHRKPGLANAFMMSLTSVAGLGYGFVYFGNAISPLRKQEKTRSEVRMTFVGQLPVVSSFTKDEKMVARDVFSKEDLDRIDGWASLLKGVPEAIKIGTVDWEVDPDSDHVQQGTLTVNLVYREGNVTIGGRFFPTFYSAQGANAWPPLMGVHSLVNLLGVPDIDVIKTPREGSRSEMRNKNELAALLEKGIVLLEERKGKLDNELRAQLLVRLQNQNQLAEAPLAQAVDLLAKADYTDSAKLLAELYPEGLPEIASGEKTSPIHHIAYVVKHMVQIMLRQKDAENLSPSDIRVGVMAALFHDVALGRAGGEGKLRKAEIDKAIDEAKISKKTPAEIKDEIDRIVIGGIVDRWKHMEMGALLAAEMLKGYSQFSPAEIQDIQALIRIHDNASVKEYDDMLQAAYRGKDEFDFSADPENYRQYREKLFKATEEAYPLTKHFLISSGDKSKVEKLMKMLREADRLWMLTKAGVDVDLGRDIVKVEGLAKEDLKAALDSKNYTHSPLRAMIKKRIADNIKRHLEEKLLYSVSAGHYGFINETLYRTQAGYDLFKELIKGTLGEYGLQLSDLKDAVDGMKNKLRAVVADALVALLDELMATEPRQEVGVGEKSRSEVRQNKTAAKGSSLQSEHPQMLVVDTTSLGTKIRVAFGVAASTVSPLLSSSPVYAAEVESVLFAGTVHYQKASVVPAAFAAKWPVLNKIISRFATASAERMVIDQRQGVPDAASVLPLVTFALYNPKAAVVLSLIADASEVATFEKELAQLQPDPTSGVGRGVLPQNFKVQAFANENEFVGAFSGFYNDAAPLGRSVALITDRENSVVTRKISSRRHLLSVVGAQNPLKQTASTLLAADKLLNESIWSMGYHFVSVEKLGGLESLMAELTNYVAAQAKVLASA